jgi:hypothetical protein
LFASLGLLVIACAQKTSGGDDSDSNDSATGSADSGGNDEADSTGLATWGEDDGVATSETGSQDGGSSSGAGGSSGGDDGSGFITEPDGGSVTNECDIWAQDCPDGEKCNAWANDGGNSWNATKCVPVARNPGQPGDECTVEGNGVSGLDSCDVGVMCWNVDPRTNQGTCIALCTGSPDNPECPPGASCSITNDGSLILCLPNCDPLLQDCPEGEACYWVGETTFQCAPDASGETGVHGDPCEYINACDAGNQCIQAAYVENCPEGSLGCCSVHCDTSDPNVVCPGPNEECVPLFDPETAPPGLENVGLCALPG